VNGGVDVSSLDAVGLAFISAATIACTAGPSAGTRNGSNDVPLVLAGFGANDLELCWPVSRSISTVIDLFGLHPGEFLGEQLGPGGFVLGIPCEDEQHHDHGEHGAIRMAVWRKFMDGRSGAIFGRVCV